MLEDSQEEMVGIWPSNTYPLMMNICDVMMPVSRRYLLVECDSTVIWWIEDLICRKCLEHLLLRMAKPILLTNTRYIVAVSEAEREFAA